MTRIDTGTNSRPGRSAARTLLVPLQLAAGFLRFRGIRPSSEQPKPFALCLYVTYRCNLRCAMCGIWRQKDPGPELTLTDFERILSDPLFSRLEFINLNGGEPNLRPDLADIASMLLRKFPRLRALTLNTNGIPPRTSEANARAIAQACRQRGVEYSISVSLHGPARTHDSMSGLRHGFRRVVETLDRLQALQASLPFFLGVNCVITPSNAAQLEGFDEWCRARRLPVNYTLGEVRGRFRNLDGRAAVELTPAARRQAADFLRRRSGEKSLRNHHALRYSCLAEMIEGHGRRILSCHYAMGGAILGARGQLYYCKQSKNIGDCRKDSAEALYFRADNLRYRERELFDRVCLRCPPNTFNRFELSRDLFRYGRFLLTRRAGASRGTP